MKDMLPKAVYKSLVKTVKTGAKLDATVADVVAEAMKNWAMDRGATHYAHVFYPLTGSTAEKHDSFMDPDGESGLVAEFSGKTLIQASQTRHLSRTAASALRSKLVVTPRGTFQALLTCWKTLTALPCASQPLSLAGRVKPSIRKLRFCVLYGLEQASATRSGSVRQRNRRLHHLNCRSRARILPGRQRLLLRSPGSAGLRPYPVRRYQP